MERENLKQTSSLNVEPIAGLDLMTRDYDLELKLRVRFLTN